MPHRTPLKISRIAHSNRHNPTDAEAILWTRLRAHRLGGIHFRRQFPIGHYIVDFCAPRKRLVIEVDGSEHLDRESQDTHRTLFLESKGYRVLRFWNNEVMNDLEKVLFSIDQALTELSGTE